MRTFWIETLGCKVNHYESDQVAQLLIDRGLVRSVDPVTADLRVVNTCSVTTEAAAKSGQAVRRAARKQLSPTQKTIAMGCWATSHLQQARQIVGPNYAISHHDDVEFTLKNLLDQDAQPPEKESDAPCSRGSGGTTRLPLLATHQDARQRAFLKVQDGCDAHCTYCIIPKLRPTLWSKPIEAAVDEARRLIGAGHQEIVLTGIFLGAYGQPTALRRRQKQTDSSLATLARALSNQVSGMKRLRFSSLEPLDLTDELIEVLLDCPQVVPHFHLPLQSGSATLLRQMNRQYARDDYLRMIDRVRRRFDRPAVTTDIITGFPGETDLEFEQTLDVVERSGFIDIHAFPFSPRPGTAAARWDSRFVPSTEAQIRIKILKARAAENSACFRQGFVGQSVNILVEKRRPEAEYFHGRCERYFDVECPGSADAGELRTVRISHIERSRTLGEP